MKTSLLCACAGLLVASALSAPAMAGDCREVKFRFTNVTGAEIKVRKLDAVGNDGSWTEDINNKKIDNNTSYTTDKRRLNKLDSGSEGDFTVVYDELNGATGDWLKDRKQAFENLECWDGRVFGFTIT